MDTRTRNKRALIILAITWVGIAAVAANWYFSRRGEANAKADLQAREAEFMATMDKIAAEEARKRAESGAPEAESPAAQPPDAAPGAPPADALSPASAPPSAPTPTPPPTQTPAPDAAPK
ncbi:MAG: hypothetical protein KF869_06500 [Phycisphaeraceae bacterium]|nr:hypothetical protein [Phycisphaeraceae bacterium]